MCRILLLIVFLVLLGCLCLVVQMIGDIVVVFVFVVVIVVVDICIGFDFVVVQVSEMLVLFVVVDDVELLLMMFNCYVVVLFNCDCVVSDVVWMILFSDSWYVDDVVLWQLQDLCILCL